MVSVIIIIVRDDYYLGLGYRRWLCSNTFLLLNASHHLLVRVGEMIQEERATLIPTRIWIPIRILATDVTETSAPTIPQLTVIPMSPDVSGCRYACIFHHTRELHLQLGIPYALSVVLGPISLISWFRNRTRRRPSSTKLMCYHRRIPRFSFLW